MSNKWRIIRAALGLQGVFYTFTGLWGIVDLNSFVAFSRNPADPFKTQANAVLFFFLGLFFLVEIKNTQPRSNVVFLAAAIAAGLAAVDLVYLLQGGTSYMFWFDFLVESIFAGFLLGNYDYKAEK